MSRQFVMDNESSGYKQTSKRKMSFDERIDASVEQLKRIEGAEEWAKALLKTLEDLNKQGCNPQRLLKYAISAKSKSFFEEGILQETSENLTWAVYDSLKRAGASTSNHLILFKFLSGQNFGSPTKHNKSLLDKVVTQCCLPALGKYPGQDRFILLLLHKICFKLPDDIKDMRSQIVNSAVNGVFLYFSLLLEQPSRRSNTEFLKVYNDMLRLADSFPKELLELKAVKTAKYVTEETFGHLDCLIEICILNLCFGAGGALDDLVFSPNSPNLTKLLKQPEFTARVEQISRLEKPTPEWQKSATQTQSSCVSTSETQMDHSNTEVVEQTEKLKITSAKCIATLLRVIPKLFIDHKLWSRILPTTSLALPKRELFPRIAFNPTIVQTLVSSWPSKQAAGWNIQLALPLLVKTSLRMRENIDRSLEEENLVVLTNLKTKLLADLRAKDSQLSLVYFWLTERSPKVKNACLECIGLFLAHQPMENYFLKIEAKSRAAQKAPTSQNTAIAKGLRSLGQLLYLELMLDIPSDNSLDTVVQSTNFHCLQRLQRIFSLGEDLGLDQTSWKTLIELYLVPTVLLYTPESVVTSYSQFEGALLTIETLIRKDQNILAPAIKTLLSKNLVRQLVSALCVADSSEQVWEDRIGLLIGFASVLYSGNPRLLLDELEVFQGAVVDILSRSNFENSKTQVVRMLVGMVDSLGTLATTRDSAPSKKRSGSIHVISNIETEPEAESSPKSKPRSKSPTGPNPLSLDQPTKSETIQIKEFLGRVLQTLLKSFSSRGKLSENLEYVLVDFVTKLSPSELSFLLGGLKSTEQAVRLLLEHCSRDRCILRLLEYGLIWPYQSVQSKGYFFRKLFDSVSNGPTTSDKMCSLSRILWGLREQIGNAGFEVVEFFFKSALYSLGSNKRKILSNAIRMVGLLLSNLPDTILFKLWAAEQTGSGHDALQSILVEFGRLLKHESPKFAWNVSCALGTILKRFKFFLETPPTQTYLQRLHQGLQEMLPQVARNYIQSGNVKLKLHSLSLLAETPGALDCLELSVLVECIQFTRDLNEDKWIDTVSPEYSDVKFLQQLKSRSTDLVVDLLPVLEVRGALWTDYQPAVGCFTAILAQLKQELIHGCKVALEDVDEDTGKLIPKAKIVVQAPTTATSRWLGAVMFLYKKVQKFSGLGLPLFELDLMRRLVKGQKQTPAGLELDNVFVGDRVGWDDQQ